MALDHQACLLRASKLGPLSLAEYCTTSEHFSGAALAESIKVVGHKNSSQNRIETVIGNSGDINANRHK